MKTVSLSPREKDWLQTRRVNIALDPAKTVPVSVFDGGAGVEWVKNGNPAGSVVADDLINYQTSDRGIKITSVNNVVVYVDKIVTFDLSDPSITHIKMRFYVDGNTTTGSINLYFSDNGFTKYYRIIGGPMGLKSGWNEYCIAKRYFTVFNGATWAEVNGRIRVATTALAGQTLNVTWDEITGVKGGLTRGAILVQFDDSLASLTDVAAPYMDKYRMPGTAFVITDKIGLTAAYTTKDKLLKLQSNGWDIASHSSLTDLLTGMTLVQAENNITKSLRWLHRNGLTPSSFFVAPGAQVNDGINAIIRKYFSVSHTAGAAYISLAWPLLPHQNDIGLVLNTTSTATIQSWIDAVEADKSVGIVKFHNILTPAVNVIDYPVADFKTVIDYLHARRVAGGIDILSFSQLIARYE